MSNKKLHYFKTFGLGEGIRYLLHYGGIEFEDIHYHLDDYPKYEPQFPYGQLPVYEEGNKRLHQSIAIARYLGTTLKLTTGDAFEDARLDAFALSTTIEVFEVYKEDDLVKRAAVQKQVETEVVEFYFSKFEKEIKSNGGYFAGKLTWVDFFFVGLVEATNHLFLGSIQKNYPGIITLIDKVHNLPSIKPYVASRQRYIRFVKD